MVEERALLPELRERIRRIERPTETTHGILPFGIAAIDRALPGGGLARGALHEILGAAGDEEDGALAAAFIAHILGRLTNPSTSLFALSARLRGEREGTHRISDGEGEVGSAAAQGLLPPHLTPTLSAPRGGEGDGGLVLWCLSRPDLYGPGLAARGLDPARVVLVRAPRDAEILWAMEEGLRDPGILAVVGEVGALPAIASRRLQLAAERSGITAFLLRRWRDGGQAERERVLQNAAVTRWRISAMPSRALRNEPGVGHARWRVELLRCRGGEPACWEVEVADATGHVSLAAALADRPAAPFQPKKFRLAG
jgi:protein ImuA